MGRREHVGQKDVETMSQTDAGGFALGLSGHISRVRLGVRVRLG